MAKERKERYLSVEETAAHLRLSVRRIQQLCKGNKIPGVIFEDDIWLIPESSLSSLPKRRGEEKPLPIGISDYKRAVTEYCYVDKTLLIKEVIDAKPQVLLFTRPRRFGKTLNMDMLRVYFEKSDEDTSIYFKDKNIWACGDKYTSEQGKYPVVFLTLKDLKFDSYEATLSAFKNLIRDEFARHKELESSKKISSYDKEKYRSIMTGNGDESLFASSLAILTDLLHKHHDVRPILIIDEYDAPLQEGHFKGYYEKIVSFLRVFFSSALKDNPNLYCAFITGVLKVAKESLFSGLNNLKTDGVLDSRYSDYFGFTPKEAKGLLALYHRPNKYAEAEKWYDGYRFGDKKVYNPWSIINYIDDECKTPKAYWVSTANNDLIGEVIEKATPEIMDSLNKLLKHESVMTSLSLDVTYPEIGKNPSSIYSFLLVAGYLTTKKVISYGDISYAEVVIPNLEVSQVYEKEILARFQNIIPSYFAINVGLSLIQNDGNKLEESLRDLLLHSISYNDAANESFYHGLTLGLCAMMNDRYRVTSNREAGEGRYDIALEPTQNNLPAIIIEIKASKNEDEEALLALASEAIKQINERHYEEEFLAKGINNVIKLGFAFSDKRVKVASSKE